MRDSRPSGSGASSDEGAALRAILEGTAGESGGRFFETLVEKLARALGTHAAWVTEYYPQRGRLRSIAFWLEDRLVPEYEYDIAGTPCAPVVEDRRLVHIPDRLLELYPGDPDIRKMRPLSYLGVPLLDLDGRVLGHLAVLDLRPMPEDPRALAIFQIFAARAASELRRLRAEALVRERDRALRALAGEADYLREELEAVQGFGEILGRSEPLQRVLREVRQVAATDATVLILGETGTGKELVARAVHSQSNRRARPFVKVNCGALPENLVESELFGHEKGAFTGATQRRPGRFSLADGGTIFLDEIGELPLPLQVKLLRVLQEGEFEPVGSARPAKVDVRVIAATNRDLKRAVEEKQFRGDLYFRLHVFPIALPPLRERAADIVLLAEAFARRFALRMGRAFEPFSEEDRKRLLAYSWPGNVRELQNVIERALIVSRDGRLDLAQALPGRETAVPPPAPAPAARREGPRVLTAAQMKEQERQNIRAALEATDWRVAGARGAAELLGMKPSTLSSRMRALGIPPRRPA